MPTLFDRPTISSGWERDQKIECKRYTKHKPKTKLGTNE
jgi:hypothetical protein